MKKIFLAAAVLLAGCTQNEHTTGPVTQPERITFNIEFAEQGAATRVATDEDFKSTWEDGDEIGVFGFDYSRAAKIVNAKLTYNAANQEWVGDIYWPQGVKELGFKAHYPYNPDHDNLGHSDDYDDMLDGHSVSTDQSTKDGYERSDRLSTDNLYADLKGETVTLPFVREDLAMVQLTIDNSSELLDPATTEVTLQDVVLGIDDIFNSDTPARGNVKMLPFSTSGNMLVFRAVVPGHNTIVASKHMFVISDGMTTLRSSATTGQIGLAAGKVFKFTQKAPPLDPAHVYSVGDRYPYAGVAKGVVYEISDGGLHGKVVSLDHGIGDSRAWSKNLTVTGATDSNNGRINMETIRAIDPTFSSHPAFLWCDSKNGVAGTTIYTADKLGVWYLPAGNEFKNAMVSSITQAGIGTSMIGFWYISSTETSETNCNSFNSGSTHNVPKQAMGSGDAIRAVMAF
ncbi:MAG: fimbrillin family protein [Alistipes sp.]|nr:fimbrillin family protein [Alistipes sp.]